MPQVKKGKGSIVSGIQRLQELLKTNRIKINAKTCMPLINELEAYSYPENKTERNDTELPEDKENHIIDGIRYALTTHDPHSHGAGKSLKSLDTPYAAKDFFERPTSLNKKRIILK